MLLYMTLLLPLLGGLLLFFFRPSSLKVRCCFVELVVTGTSLLCASLLLSDPGEPRVVYALMDHLTLSFRIDGCGRVFAALVALLWPLASLYGMEYMTHEERPNAFFTFYTMSYGVTLALCFAANLFTLYVCYECLTMITLPLVAHKRDARSQRAARNYVTFSVTGAAMAFVGLIFLMAYGTSTDFVLGGSLDPLKTAGHEDTLRLVFLLALLGFGTKAAIFPLYAWLPMVSVAPTPVTALLHAVAVVNAGAFAVLRFIYYSFGPALIAGSWAQRVALGLTAFTIVFAAVKAVREPHLKRRLAYSTISNLSYMLLGACLCTPEGMTASLTHMVCHGLMKITLFWCAGAIIIQTGEESIQGIRGSGRIMPLTCGAFVLASVALSGVPPLCGFVSKWQLLSAAAALNRWEGVLGLAALLLSSVLTCVYAVGPALVMFFRPLNPELQSLSGQRKDPSWMILLPVGATCLLMLLAGLLGAPLTEMIARVAGSRPL